MLRENCENIAVTAYYMELLYTSEGPLSSDFQCCQLRSIYARSSTFTCNLASWVLPSLYPHHPQSHVRKILSIECIIASLLK